MTVKVGADLELATIAPAMVDAIALRAGVKLPSAHERASEFRGRSLLEMARTYLDAFGVDTRGMSPSQLARKAFSTSLPAMALGASVGGHSTGDFPLILEDSSRKVLLDGFRESPSTWGWMGRRTVPDFKDIKAIRLGEAPSLLEVEEGDEYTEGTIGEERETYRLVKYGRLFGLTWETLVNDDIQAFSKILQRFGSAAKRLANNVAYMPLIGWANGQTMSDSVALFHADHGNLAAVGAELSVASLGAARAAMRSQVGVTSGVTIDVQPQFLIVPVALQTDAEKLLESLVDPAASNDTVNIFRHRLTIVSDPLLDAGSPGSSETAWYLAAATNQVDTIEVAFLEGGEEPYLEQQDGFLSDGRQFKARHAVGSRAVDWRGVYKNPGA